MTPTMQIKMLPQTYAGTLNKLAAVAPKPNCSFMSMSPSNKYKQCVYLVDNGGSKERERVKWPNAAHIQYRIPDDTWNRRLTNRHA